MPKPWPKPQGRERAPKPVHKISQMEQQPVTLIPKITTTATPTILPVISIPSRGPAPWPNAVLATANIFIARSWPLPPKKDDNPMPAMQKMMESDPSKTENTPRETIIPCLAPLVPGIFTTASGPATDNIVALSKFQENEWEPSCQCCTHTLTPRTGLVQGELGWRNTKGKMKRKAKTRRKTKTKFDSRGTQGNCSLLLPSPQYKPLYEEEPPTLVRDLPLEPT